MDMKLRQKLARMQAKQCGLFYKPQFLTESNASWNASSLLVQFADRISHHHNRILNDDPHIYKQTTDVIVPDFQRSLNYLSINFIGHINSQFMN